MNGIQRFELKKVIIIVLILVIAGIFIYKTKNTSTVNNPKPVLVNMLEGLPVYPDAKLVNSAETVDKAVKNVGKKYQAVWVSDSSVPDISKWYQEKMPQAGWKVLIPPGDPNATIQLVEFSQDIKVIKLSLVYKNSTSEITLDYYADVVTEDEEGEEE